MVLKYLPCVGEALVRQRILGIAMKSWMFFDAYFTHFTRTSVSLEASKRGWTWPE